MYSHLRALDLRPLEWNEIVGVLGGSPFIGDVVAQGFEMAQAVIVVLMGEEMTRLRDDLCLNDSDRGFRYQPRPNVLFELGYAMARHPTRTIITVIGDDSNITDIAGRHFVRLDGTPQRLRELAARLRTAGCTLRDAGSDWLNGDSFRSIAARYAAPIPETTPPSSPPETFSELEQIVLVSMLRNRNRGYLRHTQRGDFVQIGSRAFVPSSLDTGTDDFEAALDYVSVIHGLLERDVLMTIDHDEDYEAFEIKLE